MIYLVNNENDLRVALEHAENSLKDIANHHNDHADDNTQDFVLACASLLEAIKFITKKLETRSGCE